MKRWYVVQTYSGYENSVLDDLESRKNSMEIADKICRILAPDKEEEVLDKYGKPAFDKAGNKKVKISKLFPGYIFLEMEVGDEGIDDNTWFIIRNTPKVTGFLGSSGHGTKPVPIPQDEMDKILEQMGLKEKTIFLPGDKVKIVSGSFIDTEGVVEKYDEDKNIVTVIIDMLGSSIPSEFDAQAVRKIV